MIKSEVLELKKQFTHEKSAIAKMCGCYVDGDKNIKARFTESFLCMPEEETFKYFDIFKKTLSGSIGKNLLNMDFPTDEEFGDGKQKFLLDLLDSELKNDDLVDEFFDNIIKSYEYVGNYLILLTFEPYDVPGKSKDKLSLEDASEEVYNHILCTICPVKLSKPGLSYNEHTNKMEKRTQDWVVNAPINGFLFPAFNERSADIHSFLYFSKDADDLKVDFVSEMFGCNIPMSAGNQKDAFQTLIKETMGDGCDYEVVRTIHDKLNELMEEHTMKEIPEPLSLDKNELKELFADSGVSDDNLTVFDECYDKVAGENESLLVSNILGGRTFDVKTMDVIIKVNPERTDLVQTKVVDGRRSMVIEITDQVEVNGIVIK